MEDKQAATSKAAIVILNFNGEPFLRQFIKPVIEYSQGHTVYVIDNASSDGSVRFLEDTFPEVKIKKLSENHGFSGGYNLGLKEIQADYYLLLNSDVEVTPGWAGPLVNLLEANPTVGICMPKIKSLQNPEWFDYAGAAGGFIDYLGYPFCRGRVFDTIEKDVGQYNDLHEIFWASGACLVIRAELFHNLGGFDEDYFAHMEEIDLCWRAKRSGYTIMVVPSAQVFHIGGGTLKTTDPRKTFLNFRNSLYTLAKNLPKRKLAFVFALRLMLDLLAALQFIVKGRLKHAFSVIQADLTFFFSFRKMIKKRKGAYRATFPEIYNKSIIAHYYFYGRKTFNDLKASNPK